MQKILVIVAVVFSLAASALGFLNKSKISSLREESEKYKGEASASAKKAAATASELKAANEKNAVLDSDKEKVAAELLETRSEKEKAISAQTDLQKQLSDKEASLAQQKTDMAAKDARIAELESKTQSSQPTGNHSEDIKKELDEAKLNNQALTTQVSNLKTQLSSLKEREDKRKNKLMQKGLQGKILAVNSSWGFVVLSLGDRNGVVGGAEMLINRGGQLIGKVRITSVEPSSSIADIVANSVRSGLSVLPGDTVIYNGPSADEGEIKTP